MGENKEKSTPEPSLSAEEVGKKLDYIIRRLDTLERLIAQNPEYEAYAVPLRLTKMGLGLYEEPLRIAAEMKPAEHAVNKLEVAHAEIRADLVLGTNEVKVGENFSVSIEVVNFSTLPAQLVRIGNLIPEGLKLVKVPKAYRLEGSNLNLKGKLLNPHCNIEVKFVLSASTKGAFELKPKLVYLDETGNYRMHEPKSVSIKVRELGISGWLRGPVQK